MRLLKIWLFLCCTQLLLATETPLPDRVKLAIAQIKNQQEEMLKAEFILPKLLKSLNEQIHSNPDLLKPFLDSFQKEIPSGWDDIYFWQDSRNEAVKNALDSELVKKSLDGINQNFIQFSKQFAIEFSSENQKGILDIMNRNDLDKIGQFVLEKTFDKSSLSLSEFSANVTKETFAVDGTAVALGSVAAAALIKRHIGKVVMEKFAAGALGGFLTGSAAGPIGAAVGAAVGVAGIGYDMAGIGKSLGGEALSKSVAEQVGKYLIEDFISDNEDNRRFAYDLGQQLQNGMYTPAISELETKETNYLGHIEKSPDIQKFKAESVGNWELDLKQISEVYGAQLWDQNLSTKKEFISKSEGPTKAQQIFATYGEKIFKAVIHNDLLQDYVNVLNNLKVVALQNFALEQIAKSESPGSYPGQKLLKDFIFHRQPHNESELPLLRFLIESDMNFDWGTKQDAIDYLLKNLDNLKNLRRDDKIAAQEGLDFMAADKDNLESIRDGVLSLDHCFKLIKSLGSSTYKQLISHKEKENADPKRDLATLIKITNGNLLAVIDYIKRGGIRVVYYLVHEKNIDYTRWVDIFSQTVNRSNHMQVDQAYIDTVLWVARKHEPPTTKVNHQLIMSLIEYNVGHLSWFKFPVLGGALYKIFVLTESTIFLDVLIAFLVLGLVLLVLRMFGVKALPFRLWNWFVGLFKERAPAYAGREVDLTIQQPIPIKAEPVPHLTVSTTEVDNTINTSSRNISPNQKNQEKKE